MSKLLRRTVLAAIFCSLGSTTHAQTRTDAGGSVVQSEASAGSLGKDFSANAPATPNVGAGFGPSGVYANLVLIATIPANALRFNVDIENLSGAQIVVVRDDGTAPSGSAPANASMFALGGGSVAGAQGGSFVSQTFKGRLQIYAPSSSAQVAVFVD